MSVLGRSTAGDGITGPTSGGASEVNGISDRCWRMIPCLKTAGGAHMWRPETEGVSPQPSALNSERAEPRAGSRVEFETSEGTMARLVGTHRPRRPHELLVPIRLEDVSLEASFHSSTSWALKSCQIIQIRPRLSQTASIRSALHHRMMLQKVKARTSTPMNCSMRRRTRHVSPSDTREVGK